jgi:hypothetical protein
LAAVQKFEEAHDVAEWNWHEDYAGPETPTNPRDLEALRRHVAKVSAERASIEVVISDEIERIQSGVELGPRQLSSSVTQLPPAE